MDPEVVYDHGTSPEIDNSNNEAWTKGEKQPRKCNDVPFAVLFYGQLAAMIAVAVMYGYEMFASEIEESDLDYEGYIYFSLYMAAIAVILSAAMFFLMFVCPALLIKIALFFVVFLSLAWALAAFWSGSYGLGILGICFFLIGLCYARAVWSRIPFATINLITAMTAVRTNCGVCIVGYVMLGLAVAWTGIWTIALIGIFDQEKTCDANNVCTVSVNYGYLFLMFVSYFFTHQVIQNVNTVIVAGVVGTWWFSPEDSCCCGGAIFGSVFRSLTSSFGSICFGSLIVAIIQALRQLANTARQEGEDCGALLCIVECILGCIEGMVEYFNKWAYIYVGVYGYGYIDAGKNVIKLFQDRGWEAIIADDLIGNTLFMVCLIVGGLTGSFGILLVQETSLFPETDDNNELYYAFTLGLIVGIVLTSITMSIVGGSVNTVIVCYADAPAEFQRNHPALSDKMRETWRGSFPDFM